MQNYALEALEKELRGTDADLQASKRYLTENRERLLFIQDDIEASEVEVDFLEGKAAALREGIAKLVGKSEPELPKFEDQSAHAERLAQWELELLSPVRIGDRVVVNDKYPIHPMHGKNLTVGRVIRNTNVLDDFEFYIESVEVNEQSRPYNIWLNFLSY